MIGTGSRPMIEFLQRPPQKSLLQLWQRWWDQAGTQVLDHGSREDCCQAPNYPPHVMLDPKLSMFTMTVNCAKQRPFLTDSQRLGKKNVIH